MANTESTSDDLVERCLGIFHGTGDYGWRLLKQTWPDVAVEGQRRKMAAVIAEARKEQAP